MAGARSMRGDPNEQVQALHYEPLSARSYSSRRSRHRPRAQKYSDWSEPINLGPTVNSTSMDRAPAISKDGLSLYFASNRLGGFGGEDIYVSQRETRDDEWGPAMNLGPTINTSG